MKVSKQIVYLILKTEALPRIFCTVYETTIFERAYFQALFEIGIGPLVIVSPRTKNRVSTRALEAPNDLPRCIRKFEGTVHFQ